MRMTDPMNYLPKLGLTSDHARECSMPSCSNVFLAREGFAFEGCNTNTGEVHIYFFCSDVCYLTHVPLQCCARA